MSALLIGFLVFLLVVGGGIFLYWLVGGFTVVKEGTVKIIVRFGRFRKSLMVKKGYHIREDNQIVPLEPGKEEPEFFGGLLGGLRIVGIPFVDRVFTKDLKWVKSLPEGKLEDRFESNVDFLLADVHYQYGLRFKDAEDKDLLHLSGNMTLTASIVNPYKAQFAVKNWFDAIVNRVLPSVREYISNHTYEEIVNNKPDINLDEIVMKKLREPGKELDKDGKPTPSIVDELENLYGIKIHALETVNIDPDESYRKATLAKWQATRDADAELVKQEIGVLSFAAETSGREIAMISKWLGITVDVLQKELRDAIAADNSHGFENWLKKYPVVVRNWNLIQQKQLGVKPNLFGNADGSPLDPVTATIASLISLAKEATKDVKSTDGSTKSSKEGSRRKKPEDMTDEELDDELDE